MKKVQFLIACVAFLFATNLVAQNKVIRILHNGSVLQSFPVENVDSIIIDETIPVPSALTAQVENRTVVLAWNEVLGATYDVFRSSDNVSYSPIATGVTTNQYVDTAPVVGTNYYKVRASVNGSTSEMSAAPAIATLTSSELESGVYLGVMSFNQGLYSQPISILNATTKPTYDTFIDAMTMKNGTVLCYSVDQAINALQSSPLPDDIFNVAIVTFTDGLDQGSLMINDGYDSDEDYLRAINNRISTETVSGQPISAYSVGLRGSDITSAADIEKFNTTLSLLASEGNKFEVSSMTEVNAAFQAIAEQLNQTNYLQTISLKIPGLSNGTRVRFTFDNVASANNSDIYIEGTFNLRERSLTDVEYHGMTSTSGTVIAGKTEDIFVTFKFDGIRTDNGKLLSSEYIDEWYLTSSDSWQINSEFDKDENSDILFEKKSAVVMLVLDCSSSLGSQFATMQTNAKSFISTLCQTPDAEEGDDDEGGSADTPNTLYSTKPIDLSLAVVWDGVRYYLTQEEYSKANLSRATIEGVTVIGGAETFIVALEDAPSNTLYWEYAKALYGDYMPTANQGKIISARWSYVNNAIKAFGGTSIPNNEYRWVDSVEYRGSYTYEYAMLNGGGDLRSFRKDSYYNYYIRPVKTVNNDLPTPIVWNDPLDLLLAVEHNSEREYLTKEQYDAMDNWDGYNILGVVVGGEERFIIALNDEPTDAMTWEMAKQLYGNSLPTLSQCRIFSARGTKINAAIRSFGGAAISNYQWSGAEYDSNYVYYMDSGYGEPYSMSKTAKSNVRSVYPF